MLSRKIPALTSALEALATSGLRISVALEPQDTPQAPRTTYELDVLGNDRPGILSEVSRALRNQNANIIEMQTRLEPAPESGHGIFHTIATISLDQTSQAEDLAKALEELSPDLQVSLSL